MNRQQMNAPFAEEELRQFKGRGGKTMTFIEDETVMDRLDVGYGPGHWQIQVEPVGGADHAVKVRLGVQEHGDWVWYEDFGYPNQPDGEALKEAVSDGIRRCGRYVGIARDLYRKATYEPGGLLGGQSDGSGDTVRTGDALSRPPNRPELVRTTGHDGLIGKVATSGTSDYNLRQTPDDGWRLPFRVKEGNRVGQIVLAEDALALALEPLRDTLMGQLVTVWGTYTDEESPPKADGFVVRTRILHLTRIKWADGELPAPDERLPEPPPGPIEADSTPLFTEGEWAEPSRA